MSQVKKIGSVTRWLRGGDVRAEPDASRLLWARFGWRLVRIARKQLRGAEDIAYDEEDLALSTINDFYQRASRGSYQELKNREALWRLLVTISLNKARNRRRYLLSLKRRANDIVTRDAYPVVKEKQLDWTNTPDWLAIVAEQGEYLLRLLNEHDSSGSLQKIALMKLDGASNSKIAIELGCARRTVNARLAWIQGIWGRYLDQQEA